MSEARTDECGAARHLGELRGEAIGQPFTFLQGPACLAGARRMAPDPLIGVEVRGIAGQVMQGQLAVEPCDVFLDDSALWADSPSRIRCRGLRRLRIIRRSTSTHSGPVKAPA